MAGRQRATEGPVGADEHGARTRTLVVLGATGDLTGRLLLPGLGGLLANGLGEGLRLLGVGTEDWDDERWRERVRSSFRSGGARGDDVERVAAGSRYVRADVTDAADLRRVLGECEPPPALFFALPPAVTARACEALLGTDLPPGTRLVMEKPFGTDLASARALNKLVTRLVPEDHVHRVDHFLGKSTVLNLLGVRFANRMLEPVLNAEHVESVDVVFDETLGLEGRAGYYDGAGALVDMIQSHLLQVMALLAMEAPPTLTAVDLRDRKAAVLRASRVLDGDPERWSRRARYAAGRVGDRDLPAYADEPGVDPARGTETLAEVVVGVDTWRWHGVPFRLRSGKAMSAVRKEAVVTFRRPPRVPTGLSGWDAPDRLRIGFGPDRLHLDLNVNGPADPFELESVTLDADLGPGQLSPYGEVLAGVLEADPTLSVRGDTAEECWRLVEPVLAAWREDAVPLEEYPAGSDGPPGWSADAG
ncbi:glucose-6-phosphate dehydrogenase [Thalassiella azotivora]